VEDRFRGGGWSGWRLIKKRFIIELMICSREHNSVGSDMHYYIQGSGFEPQTLQLFTLKNVNSSHYATYQKIRVNDLKTQERGKRKWKKLKSGRCLFKLLNLLFIDEEVFLLKKEVNKDVLINKVINMKIIAVNTFLKNINDK